MSLLKLPKAYHPDFALPNKKPVGGSLVDLDHPLAPTHGFFTFPSPGVMINHVNGNIYNSTGSGGIVRGGYYYDTSGSNHRFVNSSSSPSVNYFETEIDYPLSTLTAIADLKLDLLGVNEYSQIITRGGLFVNNTNFVFGLRIGATAATRSIVLYSRSSGGTLSGNEFDVTLSTTERMTAGTVFEVDGKIQTYKDGALVNTDTGNTLYAGGTQKVRVGASTGATSSERGFEGGVSWVYLSETPLTPSQVKSITDNPYQILKPKNNLYYWTAGGAAPSGFQPAWAIHANKLINMVQY